MLKKRMFFVYDTVWVIDNNKATRTTVLEIHQLADLRNFRQNDVNVFYETGHWDKEYGVYNSKKRFHENNVYGSKQDLLESL